MATPIIPPRRIEEFFEQEIGENGVKKFEFTLRAFRFFEDLTANTNTNTDDNELSDIAASPAQLASVIKKLKDLELQQDIGSAAALSQIFKRLIDIGLQTDNTAMLATIIKRLNDLELQQEPQSTAAVNAAIKSTFDRRYALLVG